MTGDLYQSPIRYGGTYDESSPDGFTPRPHWAGLMEALRTLGPGELGRRWAGAERRIRENGITYNIYGDPQGANRPWQIDLVPLLIAGEEWRTLEAGVIQRAQLLSCVLEDLYGEQRLLRDGHFPPALLFANPAFLRPLVGVRVPPQSYLHLLAIDLARSPDGRWWVLADRTQAPSGTGYALENRTLVADVLPEVFGSSHVERLAPFFQAQRDALSRLSGRDDPRVVLLTPGPLNETYFEQSYLAKYLNFTLVEGADLTVRNRAVYLKTVGGLERVDVILRRVDDDFCDPLELRSESLLGISGLVDAVVAGNVQVANALGSGLIESAAVMPFLPGLARHFLGQDLRLPSVATWWCGQGAARDWVFDHMEELVIKPAFPKLGIEPVFGAELSVRERAALRERIKERPHEYVAQEQVSLSTAPVWEQASLQARSVVLRTYVLNTGEGWVVFPGGLVRVAEAHGSVVSMQRGGHSKDAWVLRDGQGENASPPERPLRPTELRRISRVVPSRVADNTFWLGRYVERAENRARMLRTMIPRVLRADATELSSLLRLHACSATSASKLPKRKQASFAALEGELLSLLTDGARWDSLPAILREVARTGGNVRERLSTDMMTLIHQLQDAMRAPERARLADFAVPLTHCLALLSAFSGLERENINRGSGWLFMSLGRRLERAGAMTGQLRGITRLLKLEHWAFLEYLLEVADSAMTYRQRYYTRLQPVPVLDVLLADETNPRSLNFQLEHLVELYLKLPKPVPGEQAAMEAALDKLRRTDLQGMAMTGESDELELGRVLRPLDRDLARLGNSLAVWSNHLSTQYFSHARTLPVSME